MKKHYLTPTEILDRLVHLDTGEIPDGVEVVKEYDSPRDFYGMFPETLCEHGIRRGLCYPCTPLKEGGTYEPLPVDMDSISF